MSNLGDYFQELAASLRELPLPALERAADLLLDAYDHERQVFVLGNGGSASTAAHFATDLSQRGRRAGERPLRVIALIDNVPRLTAVANDSGYEHVFADQVEALVNDGDLVIALSGSGRSPNVILAVERARELGGSVIGITGFDGGELRDLADVCIIAPSSSITHVEDLHLAIGHALARALGAKIAASRKASTPVRSG
jgi:D-sedoheptulose 7-phosphate isomerase